MENTRMTPKKAIKAKCLDCCCGQSNEVKLCRAKTCPLWRWRRGREEHDELYVKRPAPPGGYGFKKKEEI